MAKGQSGFGPKPASQCSGRSPYDSPPFSQCFDTIGFVYDRLTNGSLAAAPDNVLIYATSNRRHLLPEYHSDNQGAKVVDGEIHHGEAVEEKISLSERFGLRLSFHPFNQQRFLAIACGYLATYGIQCEVGVGQPWEKAAIQWALGRGNRSGRTAEQFARDWAAKNGLLELLPLRK